MLIFFTLTILIPNIAGAAEEESNGDQSQAILDEPIKAFDLVGNMDIEVVPLVMSSPFYMKQLVNPTKMSLFLGCSVGYYMYLHHKIT